MKTNLYPLRFIPILKEKIWGGEKLKTLLNKHISSHTTGESWEISDVEGDFSVVSSGSLVGKTLRELVEIYREELVGDKIYQHFKNKFPLLIKFIDAKENLSVQLHPGDELAKKRHNSFGKTEMWYILQADKDSGIIVGLKEEADKEKYLKHLNNKNLQEILNFEKVKPGDAFFIKPGLIHAIGEGVLLAEIQQTSDITYRVYDWDRKDTQGNERDLHNDIAVEAIDFKANNQFKINYQTQENNLISLVENQYFKTKLLKLNQTKQLDYSSTDSFVIYMCVEGNVKITLPGVSQDPLKAGETILIPACFNEVELFSEKSTLLEVTI